MNRIERLVGRLASFFNGIAAAAVVGMMALTCLDVVLRFFRHPIPGTYEIVGMLGAVFVSFSLARTSVDHGHIAVDFLVQRFPKRLQHAVEAINAGICALLFTVLGRQCLLYSRDLKASGEVSMTLQMPIHPFVLGIAIGCAMLSVVLYVHCASWSLKTFRTPV
ncbi:C4-dicarboxylate ABC transporter permease [Desulfosarcina alkanivorans]|uniref:C4-dicarboxylate ABC transporter permease n=1 Tax=Desulfosarcina alkanivorans TaxID=571177 RepID=A0A5K7YDX6_9BACT|nr:TRAP transporter small permease [Desulfosarcina alkanivorans]BBO66843.1 C4-dicarboxylate ABC transporter permease [Desulfosarcina alkanivorans]